MAFALVYGIALKINWISPSWAGWSVIAIAALPGGQSLQKGLLRIWGTLLACLIGIIIISQAAQERWLFMILTATWVSFCGYKMLSEKKLSYFWFVAGYVTLVISAAGPSSVGGFYIAVFRTIETILGIVIYTLVAVFIWPLSNLGSIRRTLTELISTQKSLFLQVDKILLGKGSIEPIQKLRQLQVKQMGEFSKSLADEGVENYKVRELMPLWKQFDNLNKRLPKSIDRLLGGIEDLSKLDSLYCKPDIASYFNELNARFTEMSNLLSGKPPSLKLKISQVNLDSFDRSKLSHFDNAALTIIILELNKIEATSHDMVKLAREIAGFENAGQIIEDQNLKKEFSNPVKVLDIEYLKGAIYIGLATVFGFIIWFYINPPGHSSWYIMGGVFALIFSGVPQLKTLKLIIPFLIAMILASLIYTFVLPKLTSFYELGALLFLCMFAIQYYLQGAASLVFTIIILQLVVINNPQTFDASALLNSFVFIPLFFVYLYGVSYITNAPRPEKALLKLVSRYFNSSQYLIAFQPEKPGGSSSYSSRYRRAFHLYELQTLPAKIKAWGKAVDKDLFPNTDFDEINDLGNSLDVFNVRMEILLEAKNNSDEDDSVFSELLGDWRKQLVNIFDCWDNLPEEKIKTNTSEFVQNGLTVLENKVKTVLVKNEKTISEEEALQFYHLIGGYRGVTEATLYFINVADKLAWKDWQEERFQ